MTGFGKAAGEYNYKKITVETKSVNSKQLDLNLKLPSVYREREMAFRTEVSKILERGKIDVFISVESPENCTNTVINSSLVKDYYNQLSSIADDLKIKDHQSLLAIALRMPDVIKVVHQEADEKEWEMIFEIFQKAIVELDESRKREGDILNTDFVARIATIGQLLSQVAPFEKQRIENIRTKLKQGLSENFKAENIDQNRFEQELIYYLEKIDITEEKIRLANHLEYFLETIKNEVAPGKKLGFISQEIGREINTLGSKANEVNLQKIVIQMKDELEKIKEQMLNIL